MRSSVPTPELIERVMVRDPKAAEVLATLGPKCADRWCKNSAKYVVLSSNGEHVPVPVCGTHKNSQLGRWAWNEKWRLQRERDDQRRKDASYAANLATMLTDAKANVIGITFSHDDSGNVTLSRDEAQRLLEAWS
jgi:hypothetical protein